MAHNIDFTNNRANMAYLAGTSVWHGLGSSLQPGQSIEQWIAAAGLNWEAVKVPAFANVNGEMIEVPNAHFVTRSDNNRVIAPAVVSDGYQPHQPRAVFDWFSRYVGVDERFQLETAGSLKGGAIIWGMARFNAETNVAGSRHVARLLMTTTFDASAATTNKATMVCVVCNNTLDAALADGGKSVVRTRHNTAFNPDQVSRELARIASGFDAYKAMGDAMGQVEMSREAVSEFFKTLLDIPFDAKVEAVSSRKMNQFSALSNAYRTAAEHESADCPGTVWTALNAVTRYVDHTRSTRGGESEQEARLLSSQFGSGATMKGQAMGLLMPRIKDRVPLLAA